MRAFALSALAGILLTGCATFSSDRELVHFQSTSDLSSYELRRVAVVPFGGDALADEGAREFSNIFASALARQMPFEVIVLNERDLAEVPRSETFRRGWTKPETMITLGRRFGVDGILIGDVRRAQWFPPQRLDLSVDLLAVETGVPVWSASVALDAGDQDTRKSIERWYRHERSGEGAKGESWELYLISPRLLAEFAAAQIARWW